MARLNEINQLPKVFPEGNSIDEICRFEHILTNIFKAPEDAAKEIAKIIADRIRKKAEQKKNCVLGLTTGSSPKLVYKELIRMHKEEGLSFKNVITFNINEYFNIEKDNIKSYHSYMQETFFQYIDIKPEHINIPDGSISIKEVRDYCNRYEKKIEKCGGIDIQLLGIGYTGHIGFNEPGSSINSATRCLRLDHITRIHAAGDFFQIENVPERGITMGIGTILRAKEIILLAWGEEKAHMLERAVEGHITDEVPTTYLQNHHNTKAFIDVAAASQLKRVKTPWLVGECEWTAKLTRAAVVWLCEKVNKSILKLTDRDYNDNGMSSLAAEHGPAHDINIRVFNDLQHTITGWPGGKPNADDSIRPERANPFPKRVVVFSPHPDDDVISMGGTLARLQQHNHDLHVAYQTSGNIAVSDDFALRYLNFTHDFTNKIIKNCEKFEKEFAKISEFIENKQPGEVDIPEVKEIKGTLRRGEARSACHYLGIKDSHIHFLNLPFYETGTVKKKIAGEDDIKIIAELLNKVKPHQIYAAGDLADPHGTHRACIEIILETFKQLRNEPWMKECRIWLYRGAWQEWPIELVDMAVPLSPKEVAIKRNSIFKHQSQKDGAVFPGADEREFWQRAEERNQNTAITYNKLGMAEYEAMELFVRLDLD